MSASPSSPIAKPAPYCDPAHRSQTIALWEQIFAYPDPHNRPGLSIDRKLAIDDGLFWVMLDDERVVGTIMGGYDGHRGWIYSLAVDPAYENRGIGSALLGIIETLLQERGCVKINLQILAENDVTGFYKKHGYRVEPRINMSKRLVQ